MKLSGHKWNRAECGIPRQPLYSLVEFAEKKHLSHRSLVAVMNRSADGPPVTSTVFKTCRISTGGSYRREKNLYKFADLEAWLAKHLDQVKSE
jgi:hypothetical protein